MHGIICTVQLYNAYKIKACETVNLYRKLTAEDKKLTGGLI